MSGLFGRHGRTFARAIRRQEYQRTEDGILFPRLGAFLQGEVCARTRQGEVRQHNLITNGGMDYLAAYSYNNGPLATLYVGLMGLNATPSVNWSGADFSVIGGELTDAPEGYDEATRPTCVMVNHGSGLISNSSAPSAFTMRSASSIPVYGVGLFFSSDTKRNDGPLTIDLTTVTSPTDDGAGPTGIAAYGTQHVVGATTWYDPAGDDYFDAGSGFWIDPSGDSFSIGTATPLVGTVIPMVAAARLPGAPLSFNNMDPLNITWALQVNT